MIFVGEEGNYSRHGESVYGMLNEIGCQVWYTVGPVLRRRLLLLTRKAKSNAAEIEDKVGCTPESKNKRCLVS